MWEVEGRRALEDFIGDIDFAGGRFQEDVFLFASAIFVKTLKCRCSDLLCLVRLVLYLHRERILVRLVVAFYGGVKDVLEKRHVLGVTWSEGYLESVASCG